MTIPDEVLARQAALPPGLLSSQQSDAGRCAAELLALRAWALQTQSTLNYLLEVLASREATASWVPQSLAYRRIVKASESLAPLIPERAIGART